MIAIISRKRLEHLESEADECEAARKELDRLERESYEIRSKYVLALKEIETLTKEAEERKSLLADISKTEFSIMKSANPQLISEISSILATAARHVAEGALKIRKIEGIAYRDGAFDALNVARSLFAQFLPKHGKKRAGG